MVRRCRFPGLGTLWGEAKDLIPNFPETADWNRNILNGFVPRVDVPDRFQPIRVKNFHSVFFSWSVVCLLGIAKMRGIPYSAGDGSDA